MSKDLKIPKPSKKEIEHYLKLWDKNPDYTQPENSLKKLFLETYPLNNKLDDVLIKVCSLKSLYSLVMFSPLTVAKHIVNLKIDEKFLNRDLEIVNKIADVKMNGGTRRNFYSFATKYCSFHNPIFYPIYDFYVAKTLTYFNKMGDKFDDFSQQDLKLYSSYKNVLINFRKYYKLESFNLRQIDKYLWQVGREYFSPF